MDHARRRQAARDFKERKTAAGVYAVRCMSSGEVWVGGSRNIDTQQNSLWFGLRTGGHPNKAMQAVWTTGGGEAFDFQVLERIEAKDLTPLGLADLVKARELHWRKVLGAARATG